MRINKGSAADCQELMRNARRPLKVAQNVAQVRPGITAERIGIQKTSQDFARTRPGTSRPRIMSSFRVAKSMGFDGNFQFRGSRLGPNRCLDRSRSRHDHIDPIQLHVAPARMRHPLQHMFAAYILESLPPPYTRRMTASCGQFWLERASRTNQAAKRRKLTRLK